jgi:hypothetical protein
MGNAPGKRRVGGNSNTKKWHKQGVRKKFEARHVDQVWEVRRRAGPRPGAGAAALRAAPRRAPARASAPPHPNARPKRRAGPQDVRKPPTLVHTSKAGPKGTTSV